VDDYEETIAQGADAALYGRYKDIEKLGDDVEFATNTASFKSSHTIRSPVRSNASMGHQES